MFLNIYFLIRLYKKSTHIPAHKHPCEKKILLNISSLEIFWWYDCVFFVYPQEGRATVNQDTKLDNRVIDLRVSCYQPWIRDKVQWVFVLICPDLQYLISQLTSITFEACVVVWHNEKKLSVQIFVAKPVLRSSLHLVYLQHVSYNAI